jgi:rubredoxin
MSMQKYFCDICGYVYDPQAGDPSSGVEPGTPAEDLPEAWVCPACGAKLNFFVPREE